jgi:PAS domain S-box/PAS domain S-box
MRDVFRAAFENSTCPMAIVDDSGRVVEANAAFAECVGQDRRNLSRRPAAAILDGLPAGAVAQPMETEVETRHSDGPAARWRCNATPLPGGFATLRLQSTPELAGWPYALIVDAIEEGITIRAEDGHIIGANRAARALLGQWRNPRFVKADGSPLEPGEHPAAMALAADAPIAAIIGVKAGQEGTRWLQVNSVPIRHPQAGRAVVSSFAAIDHLVETRRQLEEREARFRAIFEHTFEFIGLLDMRGRLIEANAASLSFIGKRLDEVAGKHFADTPWWSHSPEEQARLRDGIAHAAAGGTVRFETTHVGHDGQGLTVDFSLRPVRDAGGAVRFIIPEGRDVTYLKRAEQALTEAKLEAEAANHTKSAFLASTSHELRTPLNAVIGFSEAIMAEIFGPVGNPRYGEYIQLIHSAGTHLRGLIEDILDVARIETGDVILKEEDMDLGDMLADVLRLMEHRAEERKVTLDLSLPDDLPRLHADPLRIRQIALNLLSNAVKFTPAHGSVQVTVKVTPSWLRLSVTDTGIGIADEHLDSIWKPFFQADTTLARRFDGTGLGLPIVRHYVEAHGGSVNVQSTPGRGTTFTVLLPLHRLRLAANDEETEEAASA